MRLLVAACVLAAVVPARAHHPFTPYYDASKPASITGEIVELRNANPHVVLVVSGITPDGRTGLWAFEGSAPNAFLRRQKDYKERLTAGTRVTISGWAARDPTARAFSGSEVTFPDGSKMLFGSLTPGSGDGWRCSSEPCPYRYPEVTSN